ncbi:HD-GYP domain-containing protein, partial [Chitinimonas sp.]|uniref:HD-GYP domain-containing protein n=1 Tax=Chitinimonas sp. TaxID=1934313 RepID=UPI0035B459CF
DEIKTQTAPLSEEQLERLHQHPEEATARLKRLGVNDPVWLRSVLEHHEQLDGLGYPNQISGAELSLDGQLLRLADIYCARVTYREYRSAVPLTVALRDILLERGKTVDATLAAQFIRAVGIFPPGLKLRLANGETGVVVRASGSPNHPVVISLLSATGEPLTPGVYRDTQEAAFAVGETVNPATFKAYVDIEAIWG